MHLKTNIANLARYRIAQVLAETEAAARPDAPVEPTQWGEEGRP